MKKKAHGGGKGHTRKHAGSHKHHAHGAKHHPKGPLVHGGFGGVGGSGPAVHTKAHHKKHPRGLAVGDLLPVCSLEAVAMSLRLAGQPVGDDEVAWLWELSGSRELSIAEALDAAARFGLAGARLTSYDLAETYVSGRSQLLLGVDLPGPHAVLATPDGWWSWGELYSPWTRAVSEAWVISWQ